MHEETEIEAPHLICVYGWPELSRLLSGLDKLGLMSQSGDHALGVGQFPNVATLNALRLSQTTKYICSIYSECSIETRQSQCTLLGAVPARPFCRTTHDTAPRDKNINLCNVDIVTLRAHTALAADDSGSDASMSRCPRCPRSMTCAGSFSSRQVPSKIGCCTEISPSSTLVPSAISGLSWKAETNLCAAHCCCKSTIDQGQGE